MANDPHIITGQSDGTFAWQSDGISTRYWISGKEVSADEWNEARQAMAELQAHLIANPQSLAQQLWEPTDGK